jgi:hypothetical protein
VTRFLGTRIGSQDLILTSPPPNSSPIGLIASSGSTPLIPVAFPSNHYCKGHYGGHESLGWPINHSPSSVTCIPSDRCWDSAPPASSFPRSNGISGPSSNMNPFHSGGTLPVLPSSSEPHHVDCGWLQPQAMHANDPSSSTTALHLPSYQRALWTTAMQSEHFDQNGMR